MFQWMLESGPGITQCNLFKGKVKDIFFSLCSWPGTVYEVMYQKRKSWNGWSFCLETVKLLLDRIYWETLFTVYPRRALNSVSVDVNIALLFEGLWHFFTSGTYSCIFNLPVDLIERVYSQRKLLFKFTDLYSDRDNMCFRFWVVSWCQHITEMEEPMLECLRRTF